MTDHPIASLFPMMSDEEFAGLKADMKAHGQREDITLYEGKVLDGRNRRRALEELGMKPKTREFKDGDPTEFVISQNLHRRHLSISQRAMIGARARKMLEESAKNRMIAGGGDKKSKAAKSGGATSRNPIAGSARSSALAGKAVNVGRRIIENATKVLREAEPELISAVDEGKLTVNQAAKLTLHPPEVQRAEAANPTPRNARRQHKSEDNGNGEITEKGVGIVRAHEAINCLIRIPKNDALRKRGFQVVTDWIRHNR